MSQITDEQAKAAWDAYCETSIHLENSNIDCMRAALLAALSTPPVGAETGEPVAWRPMKDAPRGFPIVIKQDQWVATVILNPPSEEGHWTDGDSVIHYNGNVLVSGFHGTYDGWLPAGSAPPRSDKANVDLVTEVEGLIDAYWSIAYDEGYFRRGTDTPDGRAQTTRSAISRRLRALSTSVGEDKK